MKAPVQLILCTCDGQMALDPRAIQERLHLPQEPHLYRTLCRNEFYQLKGLIKESPGASILIGCEMEAPLFKEFLEEEGFQGRACFTDLREECFRVHEAYEANLKAVSLIRKGLGKLISPEHVIQEVEIDVGNEVLIYGDGDSCLSLASLIPPHLQPYVLIEEGFSDKKRGKFLQGNDFVVDAGRILSVNGRLGDYEVTIESKNPVDLIKCIKCRRCLEECPNDAIDTFYQVERSSCGDCQTCVDACMGVAAIDLHRKETREKVFDQVVILSSSFSIDAKIPPVGLHLFNGHNGTDLQKLALSLSSFQGRYRKEKLIHYKVHACGWGAFKKDGCMRCLEVCPVEALQKTEYGVQWDPIRCIGCGSCVSRCPNGSLTFQKPVAGEIRRDIYSLLSTSVGVAEGEGKRNKCFLLLGCERCGSATLKTMGEKGVSYPSSMLPLLLPSTALISEDHLLEAFRLGTAGVGVLRCHCIPIVPDSLQEAMGQSREILNAFGLEEDRVLFLEEKNVEDLAQRLTSFDEQFSPFTWEPGDKPLEVDGKREGVKAALEHFMQAIGREPGQVPAGAHSSFATLRVDKKRCTLCMSCVNACHPKALRAGGELPELRFLTWDCIACGLCENVCPENAVTLERGVLLNKKAFEEEILMQDEGVGCIECGKTFITRTALEKIQGALEGSPHFDGARGRLLKMCEDCRVLYLFGNDLEEVI